MKKLLSGLLVVLIMATVAQAKDLNTRKLRINGAVMDNYTFTNQVTVTSDSVVTKGNVGFASMLVDFNSLGGDLDIDMEVSADDVNFFTPYTTDGSTLTAAGGVVDTMTADRYIVLNSRMAKYTRFEFEPDSTCTVDSVYFIYQEDL